MEWGAEHTAIAGIGALFLCAVIATLHPRIALSLTSRVTLASGAGLYLASAFALASADAEARPAVAPLVLAVPAVVGLVLARDTAYESPARVRPAPPSGAPSAASPDPESWRTACDPATSGADLADLAYTRADLRAAIASNPSTPASILGWLADQGDDDVVLAIASRRGAVNADADR